MKRYLTQMGLTTYHTDPSAGMSDAFRYSLALSMFFAFAESVLPHPIVFFRYGFANIALLMASRVLAIGEFMALVALKAILSSFLSANLLTPFFLVSFLANITVFPFVFMLRKAECFSFLGVSLISSFAYNLIQSLLMLKLVLGPFAARPLSLVIAMGNVSAILTGLAANHLYSAYMRNASKETAAVFMAGGNNDALRYRITFKAIIRYAFSLACVFAFNLFNPMGEVIWGIGAVRITNGAVALSLKRTAAVFLGFAASIAIRMFVKPGKGFLSRELVLFSMFVTNFHKGADKGRAGFRSLLKRIAASMDIGLSRRMP